MVRHNVDTIVKALRPAMTGDSGPTLGSTSPGRRAGRRGHDLTVAYRDKPVLWDVDLDRARRAC